MHTHIYTCIYIHTIYTQIYTDTHTSFYFPFSFFFYYHLPPSLLPLPNPLPRPKVLGISSDTSTVIVVGFLTIGTAGSTDSLSSFNVFVRPLELEVEVVFEVAFEEEKEVVEVIFDVVFSRLSESEAALLSAPHIPVVIIEVLEVCQCYNTKVLC